MTTPTATRPRTVHVEQCMGTVFTIDIRDSGDWTEAVRAVTAWLHDVDTVFSTYRAGSDISRIGRGELQVEHAHPDVATVLDLCAQACDTTGGAFDATATGRFDPTGIVKGWAIERGAALLSEYGARNHAVNGGGDLQLTGESAPGRPWTVGIADPLDRTHVLTVLTGRNFAVATSGTSERGAHILDPFTGEPTAAVAGASVSGPSLTLADAYATAAFVLGERAVPWIEGVDGYEALVVDGRGVLNCSAGWRRG